MTNPATQIVVLVKHLQDEPSIPAAQLTGGCERAALGLAFHLREQLGATVTALAFGLWSVEEPMLAACLDAGCDHAVVVTPELRHSPHLADLDYLTAARALSAAITQLGADLILCGERSQDEWQGAVGPAVAELQNMPHLTGVVDVQVAGDPGEVIVTHRGNGALIRLACTLPVALCALSCDASRMPELTPPDLELDDDPPIEEIALADLGVEIDELERPSEGSIRSTQTEPKVELVPSARALITRLIDDHLLR